MNSTDKIKNVKMILIDYAHEQLTTKDAVSEIQSLIDASYKRGVEETLDRAIESLPEEEDLSVVFASPSTKTYLEGKNEAIKQARTNLEQLNQTHREEK
jgi:hypothetical protein